MPVFGVRNQTDERELKFEKKNESHTNAIKTEENPNVWEAREERNYEEETTVGLIWLHFPIKGHRSRAHGMPAKTVHVLLMKPKREE